MKKIQTVSVALYNNIKRKLQLAKVSEFAKNVAKQIFETTVRLVIDSLLKAYLGRWLKELATSYQF